MATVILFVTAVVTAYAVNTKLSTAADDAVTISITNPTLIGTAQLGEYPQSYVGDTLNTILKTLDDSYQTGKTYTVTNDGTQEIECYEYKYNNERYVKVTAQARGSGMGQGKWFRNGTGVTVGAIYFFNVEPILWDIFRQENQIFAVAKNSLGAVSFYALGNSGSTWQESYLRYFLNNNFIQEAGLGDYAAPRVYNASTTASDDAGDLLTDKVWAPSYLEILKFYTTNATRVKLSTEFSIASGPADVRSKNGDGFYLLRTKTGTASVEKVTWDGAVGSYDARASNAFVPAFVLSEEGVAAIYGVPTTLPNLMYNGQDQTVKFGEPANNLPGTFSYQYYRNGVRVTDMTQVGNYRIEVSADGYLIAICNVNIVACPHDKYGEWTVSKEPTCTETGSRQHTCENCGHVAYETILALGHEFTNSVVVEPTCTNRGYTKYICERCDYIYQDNYVPATGHSYGAWETIEATAETVRQRRTCQNCGEFDYRELPPYLHKITINSTASDDMQLNIVIYDNRQTPYTVQDFVNYLNNGNDFTATGTVRYYDPITNDWYDATVTRVVKVDNRSFAFYYLKNNGIEIKVVTTLSWLEISDVISRWAES